MARTNAERQAAYQKRKSKRLAECVTPDDVVEAVRLLHEQYRANTPDEAPPPFDEWLSTLEGREGAEAWQSAFPFALINDVEDLKAFDPDDAALLMKVAAVARAIQFPPQPSSST